MRYDSNENTNKTDDISEIEAKLMNDPKAQRAKVARKKIDEILEQKRLKALLDNSEDWDL